MCMITLCDVREFEVEDNVEYHKLLMYKKTLNVEMTITTYIIFVHEKQCNK